MSGEDGKKLTPKEVPVQGILPDDERHTNVRLANLQADPSDATVEPKD
jgi:hypothetical protein